MKILVFSGKLSSSMGLRKKKENHILVKLSDAGNGRKGDKEVLIIYVMMQPSRHYGIIPVLEGKRAFHATESISSEINYPIYFLLL